MIKIILKSIQATSTDLLYKYGLKVENGLLFGTGKWSAAIENGLIKKEVLSGVISRVFMSGYNDFPELEVDCNGEISVWGMLGDNKSYIEGRKIIIEYVLQKRKSSESSSKIFGKYPIRVLIPH
jgi:hypothetical protein